MADSAGRLRLVRQGEGVSASERELALLSAIERKALWLAAWTIHNANHLRPSRDGLKVGGHQASSASSGTLLTALYMSALRPQDRIAVKPHASPLMHALNYLAGRQTLENLQNFRALGGAQSYPSRTKDAGGIDFSTGSVGLGVGVTLFASIVQDLLAAQRAMQPLGRMVALMGDAELDEGNVFEALLEGWKHDVRNLWWVIDYNRQSLDGVVSDRLFQKIQSFFAAVGWQVVTLKHGKRQQAAFREPGGEALRRWIDQCPNDLYSALTFKGGAAWRARLLADLGAEPGITRLLETRDDQALQDLMTNLAGHDMASVLEAFRAAADDERPHCFVAYTIKGYGLPIAGHKDNHAGLMTPEQMRLYQAASGVPEGAEWDRFAGLDLPAEELETFIANAPYLGRPSAPATPAGSVLEMPDIAADVTGGVGARLSTQETFGRVMNALGKRDDELTRRILTMSPDVTVSTNLGPWVNHRGLFHRTEQPDTFRAQNVPSAQRWLRAPAGQHLELGIAENNLFLALAASGLAEPLFGERLLPIGTLYDPFISRGLDALNYACYQDARFMLVATPSGLTLAPEGGAHQSIATPLIGLSQPGLAAFEPAFADELVSLMRWGFRHMQAKSGGSVYFRLSTRQVLQPARTMTPDLEAALAAGAYWLEPPQAGAEFALIAMGAVLPEAQAALAQIREDIPGAGLLLVTSPGRLHQDWRKKGDRSHLANLLQALAPNAALVSLLDGHPLTLSWLGAVRGQPIVPLGVETFGQSADIPDLYRRYGLDEEAILDAAAQALLKRLRGA